MKNGALWPKGSDMGAPGLAGKTRAKVLVCHGADDPYVKQADVQAFITAMTATEVDTGDSAESYRIEDLPANGTLYINGVAANPGDVVDAADVAGGLVTFEPDANWSGRYA